MVNIFGGVARSPAFGQNNFASGFFAFAVVIQIPVPAIRVYQNIGVVGVEVCANFVAVKQFSFKRVDKFLAGFDFLCFGQRLDIRQKIEGYAVSRRREYLLLVEKNFIAGNFQIIFVLGVDIFQRSKSSLRLRGLEIFRRQIVLQPV